MQVNHSKVSLIADVSDTELILPSDWNSEHTVVPQAGDYDAFYYTEAEIDAFLANSANWDTAYDHSINNTQAHSDYLLNTGDQIDGNLIIDNTSTEAFLVRQDADGGDVFIVDTTNKWIGIQGTPNAPLDLSGADDNNPDGTINELIIFNDTQTLTESGGRVFKSGIDSITSAGGVQSVSYNLIGDVAGRALMNAGVNGDTDRRFRMQADGELSWGSGAATRDVVLYRDAADTLKTDDAFVCASLDVSDGSITNVGDIALDTISDDAGVENTLSIANLNTAYTHISTDGTSHANVHTSAMPDSSGVNTDHDVRLVAKVQIAEPSTPSPFAGMIWVDTDADGGSVAHDHTFYRQYSFMMGG